MFRIVFAIGVLSFISLNDILGQINAPPEPCSNATENTCYCNTSPILCSMDLLDGFQYSMTTNQTDRLNRGPDNPMCNPNGGGTTAHNPTWFRFLAWCEDIDLEVFANNCTRQGGCRGIQLAVFPQCTWDDPNSAVACNVNNCMGFNGPNNQTLTISMTGLVVGEVYSMIVDGCCNSACDITITVTSPPCPATLGPWPDDIMGPTEVCVGDCVNYEVEIPSGGRRFDWTVDDDYVFTSGALETETTTTFERCWDTPGTYELCVDAWNTCVAVTDDPEPTCITVTVYEADAGTITATPTPTCPGNTVNISVTGENDEDGVAQYIIIVDGSGNIVQVTEGTSDSFTWDECADFTAYSYNFVENYDPPFVIPAVGDPFAPIQDGCNNNCCDLDEAPFSFADTDPPVIVDPPADITVACFDDIPDMPDLSYTDNCIDDGTVEGEQVDDYTNCDGGTVTRTWTVTDLCGNESSHQQIITIEAIPEATFADVEDQEVTCDLFPLESFMPTLFYTNGRAGACLISGNATPERVVDTMLCVGTVTYTWTVTDLCDREISTSQVYTILPPPEANWVNPPADLTVPCTGFPEETFMPTLNYDNGGTGLCRVFGVVDPVRTVDTINCEGTVTYTWQVTDRCGRDLFHQQVYTILPPDEIQWINLPVDTMTIECADIPEDGVLPPLFYTNNSPPGRCLIEGSVIPDRIDAYDKCGGELSYFWEKLDSCGRSIDYLQILYINPAPAPDWIDPPADVTYPCGQIVPPDFMPELEYTNGFSSGDFCEIAGSVIPTRTDNLINDCEGTVTFDWFVTTDCGHELAWTQVITLSPPAEPQWINPPADQTVQSCDGFDFDAPRPLSYDNFESGIDCEIAGSVDYTRTGDVVDCAGEYVYTWTITDQCGREYIHTQTITVIPPPEAEWVNPPTDETVICTAAPDPDAPLNLSYTNNASGDCLIAGTESALPVVLENPDCSKVYTYEWEFIDDCNRSITHIYVVNVTPPDEPQWINPPADQTVQSCDGFDFDEARPLSYDNGMTGDFCGIMGSVDYTRTGSVTDCEGQYTYTWEFMDDCGRTIIHTQTITVIPPPEAQWVNPPSDETVICTAAPDPSEAIDLVYTNNASGDCLIAGTESALPVVLENPDCSKVYTYEWEFTDDCNRTIMHTYIVNVAPPDEPQWINPPADQTVQSCDGFDFDEARPLSYDNGMTGDFCGIMGSVDYTRTGSVTDCEGEYTYTWEFMDDCGRTITHTQTITVIPPPEAQWVNPPTDGTVICTAAPDPDASLNLSYTNNASGDCLIAGTESALPVVLENPDCSKVYTYEWEFTDDCNRTIMHTYIVNVAPPDEPQWINPPADQTVQSCDGFDFDEARPLSYDNGMTGDFCGIMGSVDYTRTGSVTDCEGEYTYTWEFMDDCGRTITHTQTITVIPPPEAQWVNPPSDQTFSCVNAPDPTEAIDLEYSNNASGDCLIAGIESALPTVEENSDCSKVYTYEWEFTDDCNRTIMHTYVVNVNPPPQATFTTLPPSQNVVCTNAPDDTQVVSLNYTNGVSGDCAIEGSVDATPVVLDNPDCSKTITYEWEFTDNCGRTISHSQVITVQPPAEASFINPPPPVRNVPCDEEPDVNDLPRLSYTNNSSGDCLIEGEAIPTFTLVDNGCAKTYTLTWEVMDFCNRSFSYQQVINVQPPPIATFIDPPVYSPISCDVADDFDAPNLFYTNSSSCEIMGEIVPRVVRAYTACGGNIEVTWSGQDDCGRPLNYSQIIVVNPAPAPEFTTLPLPDDITVDCQDITSFAISLEYSNGLSGNCDRSGIVAPVISNQPGLCGGTATLTWRVTDNCGFTLTHTQNITVEPTPQAEFINTPDPSSTIACDEIPPSPPTLSYTNNQMGSCAIDGAVSAIQTGMPNICGGAIQYTWQYTDVCNRPIVFNQTITVEPAPDPDFVDVPDDQFLPCLQGFTPPPALNYTNGLTAPCGISGSVNPSIDDNGNSRTYTWSYTNACTGNTIEASQTVTISPVPDIIADPTQIDICSGDVFDLQDIDVTDLNGTNITLTYHNGTPADFSNQMGTSLIFTDFISTYYILATNEFGCTDEVRIDFNTVFPEPAGTGQVVSFCNDGRTVNLWDFLDPPYNPNGFWSDDDGYGIDVSDPENVSLAGLASNNYILYYNVPSGNVCPDAQSFVQIELVDPGDYQLLSVECSPDFSTYTVTLDVFGYNVTSNFGTISTSGNNTIISGIPIGSDVLITFSSTFADCGEEIFEVNPPQCNCPTITPPDSGGNRTACQGSNNVALTVTVQGGLTADWYDAPTGGNLVAANTLTFTPPANVLGPVTYYVRATDPVTGCFSIRIPVVLNVVANPTVRDTVLARCDDNMDGILSFDLTEAHPLIFTGGGVTFEYYLTLSDAQNATNALSSPYTNLSQNQEIFVRVINSNGCSSIARLTLRVLPLPDPDIDVMDVLCSGGNSGSITVLPPVNGLEFRLNTQSWTNSTVFSGLTANTYQLSIRDTNGCTSVQTVTIDNGLQLTISSFTSVCNNNGTASNSSDDTYDVTLNVISNPVSTGSYTVTYNGLNYGPFSYGVNQTFALPADGSSGQLIITDNDTGCQIPRNVGPLNNCSTTCDLTVNNLQIDCDDSGTDDNPADDVYTITFTVSAVNSGMSNSFNLLINGVIQNQYNYGDVVQITLPANGTTPDIIVRDFSNINCFTDIPVGPLSGCSGACSLTSTVTNVVCNDNGTINDPGDDTYTFTIRVTGFNISGSWTIEGTGQTYAYNTNINLGPFLISDGDRVFTVVDGVDAGCRRIVTVEAPDVCSEPCVLDVTGVDISPCNNNGSNNTENDDTFNVSFTVNVVSGSTNFYNVRWGTRTFGPFNYGQVVTVNDLPANGQILTLTITDGVNPGCEVTLEVSQNPCSECIQTADAGTDILLTCSQNTATLSGTASQTGGVFVWTGPNNFNRQGQTVTASQAGTYLLSVTFPDGCVATDEVVISVDADVPVADAGPDQELTCNIRTATLTGSSNLTGNVDYIWTNGSGAVIGNTATITVGAVGFYYLEVLNTVNNCRSGKDEVEVFDLNQQLTFNRRSPLCDNNGTSSDATDDFYTITFNLSNSTGATNTFRIFFQGAELGVYGYNSDIELNVPADGSVRQYEFIDDVTGCRTTADIGPLNPCSTDCELTIENFSVQCFDAGTESDESDDYYEVTFSVSALNGSARFKVFVDGIEENEYTYGTSVTLRLDADGTTPFIEIRDVGVTGCQIVVPVNILTPCSSTCNISALVSGVRCDDNGTINDPTDDIFFFDIQVTGFNITSGWVIQGETNERLYNTLINLGPYPISSGNLILNLTDAQTPECSTTVTVTPPAVCSEPCVLQVAALDVLPCNDNGTGDTDADDVFGVRFIVNRVSGSTSDYSVTYEGTVFGPFNYGELISLTNLPANGNELILSINDNTNGGCVTEVKVRQFPCSTCSQTVDAGLTQNITCDNSVITLTGTASEPGGTFVWTGPNGFVQEGNPVTTTVPGTYTLIVTFADQCVAQDNVEITQDADVPTANAGEDKILNCLVDEVQLIGITNLSSNVTFTWRDSLGNIISTDRILTTNTPGVYTFEVLNNSNNCLSAPSRVQVVEDTEVPDAVIIADPGTILDCIVGTVILSGQPVANVIFNWQTGETFINNQPSITINTEGFVTMFAIDTLNGCESMASIEIVDLQDYPLIVVEDPEPITCVNNGVTIDASGSPAGPNLVFTWFNGNNDVLLGETGNTLYVTSPGTYYVELLDTLNNCSNRDTITVDRLGDFPVVQVSPDQTLFCGVDVTSLTASVLNPAGAFTLGWSTVGGSITSGTSQNNITVRGQGSYLVRVEYTASGCVSTERVQVTVNDNYPTAINTEILDETCLNENDGQLLIRAVSGGEEPLTFFLNGVNRGDSRVFSPLGPGLYNLEVRDANNCVYRTSATLRPGREVTLTGLSPIEIIYNQSDIIELVTNLRPDEIASVRWTPPTYLSCDTCLVTSILAQENITYSVEIVDINGCSETINITVRVRDNTVVTVPSIFNPGGLQNSRFTLYGNESVQEIVKMSIYDRWGNLVFTKSNFPPNDPLEGWDGRFNGVDVVQGVFVYTIEYRTPFGVQVIAGDVTVVK